MPYSPRNIKIAWDHRGLTHFGGVHFFPEFLPVLPLRHFLATHLAYPRRNHRYRLSPRIRALVYPIVLGLERLETASFLRSNGTFPYLSGLPSFPDPQTLRRFLLPAPDSFWEPRHRGNDRLLQPFVPLPEHRSRLILDIDSTGVTVFGHQEPAAVGSHPRYRGKRSYHPLLCLESHSSFLWDTALRPGHAGTWEGSVELWDTCFANGPPDIREGRVRADAGCGFHPVFEALEARPAPYAVVARWTSAFRRWLPGLRSEAVNRDGERAGCEHRPPGWPQARRFVVARRFIPEEEAPTTRFPLGRSVYRAWVTNRSLTPAGVWHFYDGRAGREPRSGEWREDLALRKIPTASFAAHAWYWEIIRLACNLVTALQRNCWQESWQNWTLAKLRYKLFWLPGELTRPPNRPVLRLRESPMLQNLANDVLAKIRTRKPLQS